MDMTPHDTAIWHTCHLNELMDAGRLVEWQTVPVAFATRSPSEQVLTTGPFQLLAHTALGDGSYAHDSGFFFATGRYGAALTIGAAVGRASANAARRRRAAEDATTRWRAADAGQVFVSTEGFYLSSNQGFFPWDWWSVQAAELVAPAQVMMTGSSEGGPVRWVLCTDWAELIFTCWARARHPQHPQFDAGRWIPPGWQQRVVASGATLPVALSAASQFRGVLGQ